MHFSKIKRITKIGTEQTYDILNLATDKYKNEGNFIIDDVVVHNSIPDVIKNRDDKSGKWREQLKALSEDMYNTLESTYGKICLHEDTLISLADGSEVPIKYINNNTLIHSVCLESKKVNHNIVELCTPTVYGDGLCITLDNGYELTITDKHRILGWDGLIEAKQLNVGDLVAAPEILPQSINEYKAIAPWIGNDIDIAYLFGQLIGDGMVSGTSTTICAGHENACDVLINWINQKCKLRTNKFYHCRAWYIGISSDIKEESDIQLPPFTDTSDWWNAAYKIASGSDIAKIIKKSTWLVYNRLQKYTTITTKRKRPFKTKWHKLLNDIGLNKSVYNKRVPHIIMRSDQKVRMAFLAGLIDSDGTISTNNNGADIVHITSASKLLLQDIRKLLQIEGIVHKIYNNRIFIWNTQKLCALISPYLILKSFNGNTHSGKSIGWVPKEYYKKHIISNYTSIRELHRLTGLSRNIIRHKCQFVKHSTAITSGIYLGDLRYHKIIRINKVENQQFYDLSVANDHTLIANGIVVSNCYQEQLAQIWQMVGGFTATEAQEARKAVAKKWVEKLKPIKQKWLSGASLKLGKEKAAEWWDDMESFGRYAFNKCLSKDTLLTCQETNVTKTIEQWYQSPTKPKLKSYHDNNVINDDCIAIHDTGRQEVFKVTFDDGSFELVTLLHKFLCEDGEYHELREIIDKRLEITKVRID